MIEFYFGKGDGVRTHEWRSQSPLPYRLATPLILAGVEGIEPILPRVKAEYVATSSNSYKIKRTYLINR